MDLSDVQLILLVFMIYTSILVAVGAFKRREGAAYAVYRKSMSMLLISSVLLTFHFALQYYFQIRQTDPTCGSVVNILFFYPSLFLTYCSMLYLQHCGRCRNRKIPLPGVLGYLMILVMVGIVTIQGGWYPGSESLERISLVIAIIFSVMSFYYSYRNITTFLTFRKYLDNHFDNPTEKQIWWTAYVALVMFVLSILLPFAVVFWNNFAFSLFGLVIIILSVVLSVSMAYFSSDISVILAPVLKAMEEDNSTCQTLNVPSERVECDDVDRIKTAIESWKAEKKFTRTNLVIDEVAQEMDIPKYLLSRYINDYENASFSVWLAKIRIEYAKQLMKSSPAFDHTAISEECGFNSRSYFQTTFRKLEGVTPNEWLRNNR